MSEALSYAESDQRPLIFSNGDSMVHGTQPQAVQLVYFILKAFELVPRDCTSLSASGVVGLWVFLCSGVRSPM